MLSNINVFWTKVSDVKFLKFTLVYIICKNPVRTSMETNCSARKWKKLVKTEMFYIAFDTYQFY
jgi:hypothetical protein